MVTDMQVVLFPERKQKGVSQWLMCNSHPWLGSGCVNTRDMPPETISSNTKREQQRCTAWSTGYNCQLAYWLALHAASCCDDRLQPNAENILIQGQELNLWFHTQAKTRAPEVGKQQEGDLTSNLTLPSIYWITANLIPAHKSLSGNCISSKACW